MRIRTSLPLETTTTTTSVIYAYAYYAYASLEKEKDPPVTHGIRPRRATPGAKNIYVPPVDRPWVEMAAATLQRDGSSLSAFVLEELRKWWEKHAPGNPQTGLERYVESAPVLPGPDVPGSINYLDRKGEEHWGWLMDLPDKGVIFVRSNGKKEFLQLRLA